MSSLPPNTASLLATLSDVSPVFVQRFLDERGIVPGKGYSRDQTLARLGKMRTDGTITDDTLRDLALDWCESGEKHVYVWNSSKANAKAIAGRFALLPKAPALPPTPTSADPQILYARTAGALSKLVLGQVVTALRPNYDTLDVLETPVPVRAVLEVDHETEIASLSIDPPPTGLRQLPPGSYAESFINAALGHAPELKDSPDLSAALGALEKSPLVRLSSTRAVDHDSTVIHLSSQVELRDGESFKAVSGKFVVRETGRYIWKPGHNVSWDGLKLSLRRELRTDIDAQQKLIRLQSQTTSQERRYVICQIHAHL